MQNILVGLVLSGCMIGIAAFLPGLIARKFGSALDAALAQGDENDDELVLAMVKWAEKKLPDPNTGKDKYRAVANLVAARFPLLKADQIEALIEETVSRMEAEAAKRKPQ